jgi:hypothetical protein
MEESLEIRVSPEKVWASWENAHAKHGSKIKEGHRGISKGEKSKGFRYQVLDVIPGRQFTILWKTLFVRLLFSHCVTPIREGSEIRYTIRIKGFFAWPVRWFLGKSIRQNVRLVLKTLAQQLEKN